MKKQEPQQTIIQPAEIFARLNIEHTESHEKVLEMAFAFLVYLKPGEALKVGGISFRKLDEDTINLDIKVTPADVSDALASKRSIRIAI